MNMSAKNSFKTILDMSKNILSARGHLAGYKFKPYVMFQIGNNTSDLFQNNVLLRINRMISESSLKNLSKFSFWSENQIPQRLPKSVASNSFVSNPFKTQKMIRKALLTGIRKMIVEDIEELQKIQKVYFSLLKKYPTQQIPEPQILWTVQGTHEDFQTVQNLKFCELEIDGLYFRRQYELNQIKMFLQRVQKLGHPLKINIKEVNLREYQEQKIQLQKLKVSSEIIDYSEVENYLMAARIIGKDSVGKNIFADQCYEYINPKANCKCEKDIVQVGEQFSFNNSRWKFVKPNKVHDISPDFFIRDSEIDDRLVSKY